MPKSSVLWDERMKSGLPSGVPVLFALVQAAPGPGFVVQRPRSPTGAIEYPMLSRLLLTGVVASSGCAVGFLIVTSAVLITAGSVPAMFSPRKTYSRPA